MSSAPQGKGATFLLICRRYEHSLLKTAGVDGISSPTSSVTPAFPKAYDFEESLILSYCSQESAKASTLQNVQERWPGQPTSSAVPPRLRECAQGSDDYRAPGNLETFVYPESRSSVREQSHETAAPQARAAWLVLILVKERDSSFHHRWKVRDIGGSYSA